jgi:hypothetical protein
MDTRTFDSALAEIGWSQAEFCRRACVNQDSTGRWRRQDRTPAWVDGFLAGRLAAARAYRELVEVKRGKR